ncbi:MFS transporter [Helicovermis profundi]|uniref:MFS transporter n=1 Tax=Helicovermis profundi TaxID=3065157 RepID=A0AAU9ENJ5_9FIRM|nr:MFS transporter [Clostridia bacterium S502]
MNLLNKVLKPYKSLPKEVYIIFFARMINAAGMFVFPLLTLLLTKKIGLKTDYVGYIIALMGIVFSVTSLIGGKLVDSFGRKKVIIIFDSLAIISFIMCSFLKPSMLMVGLIILAGSFMGMSDPGHNALLADVTSPENRDGSYSLSYLGFNIGFILGPMIGGMLFDKHLKLFFIIDAVTAFISLMLIVFFIGETIGMTEDIDESRNMEQKVEGSILKVILKRPILLVFSLILLGYNFTYSQWGFLMPYHASQNFTDGVAFYGKIASLNGFVVMVFTPILTYLFIKKTNINKVAFGGILYTLGFGMLGFYDTKLGFIISAFTFTLGEILITTGFMPFIANHTPSSHRGRMSSVLPMIMGLGYVLGPVIVGKMILFESISYAWKIIGLVMFVSTLFMYMLLIWEGKKSKIAKNYQKQVQEDFM